MITIIAAHGKSRQIGLNGKLPWNIKEEFQHFKNTTMGGVLIMGRKTFESLPNKQPLPGRTTIIVTRNRNYPNLVKDDPVEVSYSLIQALAKAEIEYPNQEIFICGGSEIYKQALLFADRMLISLVDYDGEADTYFPVYRIGNWEGLYKQTPNNGWVLNDYRRN